MRSRSLIGIGLLPLLLALASCGGGGGSSIATSPGTSGGSGGGQTITTSGANVVTMTVDAGPPGVNAADIPYITVTVCNPGNTSQCQTFDHIEVDTGSYGFRILADATDTSGNAYGLSLPPETDSGGNPLAECTAFVDGYSWGPVATADLQISGEAANGVPVQVIGDPGFPAAPSSCSTNGTGTAENTVSAFGANGILGVGPFTHDCGSGCVGAANVGNGVYYTCPPAGCQETALSSTDQEVSNPVPGFPTDNNGVIIELPPIASSGAPTATGSLVFGIGTEGNNGLSAVNVLTADSNGYVTTSFNGQSLPQSLFDTGSNAYYFDDPSIPTCTASGMSSWFCPSSPLTLGATNYAVDSSGTMTGQSSSVTFYVDNAQTLFNSSNTAFNDIAASSGSQAAYCQNGSSNCSFDFGLPFFFGRDVYVAISGANTPAGLGPYFAY